MFRVKKLKKEYYFQTHSKNVKNTLDGIKSIVTMKSKDKNTAPNSLIVNGNDITKKIASLRYSMIFLLMMVQILRLKYRKEKYLLIHI